MKEKEEFDGIWYALEKNTLNPSEKHLWPSNLGMKDSPTCKLPAS